MEPGAAGFRDAIQRKFLDDADAFHASLPRHLRPELTLKLREFESQVVGTAGRIETAEGERFELGRIDEAHKKLLARVAQNPGALPAALAESDALIDASTRLTAVQKDEMKRKSAAQFADTQKAATARAAQQQAARLIGQFDELLAADPDKAASWLDANKPALDPRLLAGMRARLDDARKRRTARDIANDTGPSETPTAEQDVRAGPAPRPNAADYTEPARKKAEARTDASPELTALAEQAARDKYERHLADWNRLTRAALKAAYDWADANPGVSLSQMPPGIWPALDYQQRRDVASYVAAKGKVTTDPSAWYRLQKLATTDRDAFSDLELLDYKRTLSPDDFRAVAALQAKARAGDPGKDLVRLRKVNDMVGDALRGLGVNPDAAAGTSDERRSATLRRLVQDELTALESFKGKPADPAEIQATIDRLTIKLADTRRPLKMPLVVGPGIWVPGVSVPLPFMTPDRRAFEFVIDDVPAADRKKIEAALRRRGLPVNDNAIVSLYARQKAREHAK
ncbi:MAG: hypothetical protein KIT36_23580 [Alphaproteobacteria bacterium]|nr:hypothetical protein [Alphaproteobacteria bacterium]